MVAYVGMCVCLVIGWDLGMVAYVGRFIWVVVGNVYRRTGACKSTTCFFPHC